MSRIEKTGGVESGRSTDNLSERLADVEGAHCENLETLRLIANIETPTCERMAELQRVINEVEDATIADSSMTEALFKPADFDNLYSNHFHNMNLTNFDSIDTGADNTHSETIEAALTANLEIPCDDRTNGLINEEDMFDTVMHDDIAEPVMADVEMTILRDEIPLEPIGLHLLDDFCEHLERYHFQSEAMKVTEMEYVVQTIDELMRIAKVKELDLAQKNGTFYYYNGQFWERMSPDSIKTFIRNATTRFGVPRSLARSYKFEKKAQCQFRYIANFPFVENDGVVRINLKSNTLELREGQAPQIVPFDKKHGLCYQLGYDFDPEVDCPQYRAFLDRCVPDYANQLILGEYAGYTFINHLNFEKVLMLYGQGGNGKSVWLAATTAVFGKHNVTDYSLESVTKRPEYRAQLAHGMLNICAESATSLNIEVFKKIASREPLECRRLYENPFIMKDYSRQICSTNRFPNPTETTEGYFRRLLMISFEQFIPLAERNFRMNKVEFWEESGELPGILNTFIAGLQRLVQNNGFTPSASADALLEKYRSNADSVWSFMQEEHYTPCEQEKVKLKYLYGIYRTYCDSADKKLVDHRDFADRLRQIGYKVALSTGKVNYVWCHRFTP